MSHESTACIEDAPLKKETRWPSAAIWESLKTLVLDGSQRRRLSGSGRMGDGIVTVGRRRATPRSTRAYRPSGDCLNIIMLQGTLLFASLWRRLRNSS